LAEHGHYPAIDIEASISRAMHSLVTSDYFERVRRFKSMFSRYQRNRDLISVGAYVAGSDPQLDVAIAAFPLLEAFLHQDMRTRVAAADAVAELAALESNIAVTG
jgi:flagellum-specific ATP synthase